jgi:hypothetical protein
MITYTVFTDRGGREVNEDSARVFEKDGKKCLVLCDGLGGHGKGEVASALVVEVVGQIFNSAQKIDEDFLRSAFQLSQEALIDEQIRQDAKTDMKTTAVAMYIDGNKVQWGHVGDSRLYAFAKNKVKLRTLDHSVPQMLVFAREIKEKQIRNHPDRNRLLRVMGIEWEKPMYELAEQTQLEKYQAFLLCSDGFWELIDEKQMCKLLKNSSTVEEWMQAMVEVIKQNGIGKNMDNYTAIALWC